MSKVQENQAEIVDRLARFFFLAKRYGESLHKKHAITSGERAILYEIAKLGPQAVPDMADRRGLTPQAIQKTVDALTKRGLVKKVTPPENRRSRITHLTKKGLSLIETMVAVEKQETHKIMAGAPVEDYAATVRYLDWLEETLSIRINEIGKK